MHPFDRIELRGRELAFAIDPAFDLYKASRVLRLAIELEGALPTVTLDLEYKVGDATYAVRFVFDDVRRLVVPPAEPQMWVPELEIADVRRDQREGIRYEAISQFDRSFICECRDLALTAVQKL